MTPERRSSLIKSRALALGFSAAGITDLEAVPHGEVLRSWLAAGFAGTMGYMQRQATRRLEPATIVKGAKYAVVVTRNYFNPDTAGEQTVSGARVAKYARGPDYHDSLQKPLRELAEYMRQLGRSTTIAKPYVDAGPVPERELAQRAGLGWIGKNTMLIEPSRGSFSFIATVLTDLDLAVDAPFEADRCGTCRRCLDACPTDAFPEARVLDSRRCISYLTIEHAGPIDEELQSLMGDWVFGCDICQDVCPWNHKFAEPADDVELAYDPALACLEPHAFDSMSATEFEARFGTTALSRPGLEGMRRNAAIVAQNLVAACTEEVP